MPFVFVLEAGVLVGDHIPVMEERILLQPDVDERRLQVVLQILDPPLEDAPHESLLHRVLHLELLHPAVLNHGNAGFQFLNVHHNFALLALTLK